MPSSYPIVRKRRSGVLVYHGGRDPFSRGMPLHGFVPESEVLITGKLIAPLRKALRVTKEQARVEHVLGRLPDRRLALVEATKRPRRYAVADEMTLARGPRYRIEHLSHYDPLPVEEAVRLLTVLWKRAGYTLTMWPKDKTQDDAVRADGLPPFRPWEQRPRKRAGED